MKQLAPYPLSDKQSSAIAREQQPARVRQNLMKITYLSEPSERIYRP